MEPRKRFEVIDELVTAAHGETGAEIAPRTPVIEHLVPRIVRRFELVNAPFTGDPAGATTMSARALEARVAELGPWAQKFDLGHGVCTRVGLEGSVAAARLRYRRGVINGTVAELLGDDLSRATALDIGCNSGFFSMDLAARGAADVYGVDLRTDNIDRAKFLAGHYDVSNVAFDVLDAEDRLPEGQWDVVLNLGLLYHVTDPLGVLRRTYEATRRFAVIDTLCRLDPISALYVVTNKDVTSSTEGRSSVELHPSYRATLDMLAAVGFSEVYEVVADVEWTHEKYRSGGRRCFVAMR